MRLRNWLLALSLAACGGTATTTQAPITTEPATTATTVAATSTTVESSAFPVTISTPSGDVTIDERPEAIISLAPALTEMLAAIGALDQVVAVDDQSDFPTNVPVTDLSGFNPNIEAIASYEPDLVVVSNDIDGMVGSLQSLSIPVLLLKAAITLDDVYAEIEQLGAATGHASRSGRSDRDHAERDRGRGCRFQPPQ